MLSHLHLSGAAAMLLCIASSSCSIWLPSHTQTTEWEINLPADAAAAIVSAATVCELRAEPVSTTSGAPARILEDGSFLIELSSDGQGQWLPIASHRLILRAHEATPVVEQVLIQNGELLGFANTGHNHITVEVAPSQRGATLRLWASGGDFPRIATVIGRSLLLATSLKDSGPGLAEANLSAWRLARLISAANNSKDVERRGNLLRRAARLPTAPTSLFRELAQLSANNGDFAEAAGYIRRGLLAERSPARRAQLAALAHNLANRMPQEGNLRLRAIGLLAKGKHRAAEKTLHSARRTDSKPAVDYRLLGHLHRHRGDEMAALAAELLAREYSQSTSNPMPTTDTTIAMDILRLAPELPQGRHLVSASAELYGSARARATPPR